MFKQKKIWKNLYKVHIKKYLHLSCKSISAIFMLSICIFGMIFLFDPSLFSASLITNEVLREENRDFIEVSESYGGTLPNSPLYMFYEKINNKSNNVNQVFVDYIKIIKAAQINKNMANKLYYIFLNSLDKLSNEDKKVVLSMIIEKTQYSTLDNKSFPFIFEIYTLLNKETLILNRLLISTYKSNDINELAHNSKVIFESLEKKPNWEEYLLESNIISQLSKIKQLILIPLEINGEVLHAASEPWMEKNYVWKSIKINNK